MKSNKIVHMISDLKAGEETIMHELLAYLARNQYKQAVICFQDGSYLDRIRSMGIPVHQVQGLFFQYDPIFWMRLQMLIRKLKPLCIHSSLGSCAITARIIGCITRIPSIVSVTNPYEATGVLHKFMHRCTINLSHTIVAGSQGIADSIMHENRWMSAQKIKIIENGIDAQAIKVSSMHFRKTRYDLELGDEHTIIGSVGHFTPARRYGLLIESFALINTQYPLTRLVLIGSGPETGTLKKQVVRLGLEQDVIFVDDPLTHGYYELFDLFILPIDNDGIAMPLLEALSFGLPSIVGTDQQRHPVIMHGYNGYCVVPNARAMAHAVQEIVENEPVRKRISERAKQTVVESFSIERTLASYHHIFSDLTEKSN